MTTILETEYDVKRYQNGLTHNLKLLEDLNKVNKVSISKEAWEPPVMTFWQDDKQLTSRVINSYPKTKSARRNLAHKLLFYEINEVKAIIATIREELDNYIKEQGRSK